MVLGCLGGIAAALGLVADDAIVVVENIHRHRELAVSAHPVLTGTGELLPALIGSSLSTIVVFVPFAQGKPSGPMVDVLTGFLSRDEKAYGRPVGVAIDKRGALLVADDWANAIYRISHGM